MTAVLGLLGRVPLLAWALVAALAWGGLSRMQLQRARVEVAQVRAEHAQAVAAAATATQAAERREREREQAMAESVQGVILNVEQSLAALRADAARGVATQRGLHDAARAYAERACRAGPAAPAPGSGPAAQPSPDVLAELFIWADTRAGEIAAFADASRAAGLGCERAYELTR